MRIASGKVPVVNIGQTVSKTTAALLLICAAAWGDQPQRPAYLSIESEIPSVYAPPSPITEADGTNLGGVKLDLEVRYMTDYIFRGVEILEVPASEDAANLQIAGQLSFDLGKLPHPFVGAFVNIADQDPLSQFQEIRPFVGADWLIRPFTITGGFTSYIYPDRSELDTSEVYLKLRLDDAWVWSAEKPLLSPYVLAAYDYDTYDGWYLEAGVEHDFEFDDLGIDLKLYGQVAYVYSLEQYQLTVDEDQGFQHWQVGAIARYSLNKLLNTSERYGRWDLTGYLNYTGSWDNDFRSEDQFWGGVGIGLHY